MRTTASLAALGILAAALPARADHLAMQSRIIMSPDGVSILAAGDPKKLRLLSMTGKTLLEIPMDSPALRLEFAPDGKRLAVAAEGGAVSVIDLADGSAKAAESAGASCVGLVWTPDGKRLVYALELVEDGKRGGATATGKTVTIKHFDVQAGQAKTLDSTRIDGDPRKPFLPVHPPEPERMPDAPMPPKDPKAQPR